MLGRRRVTASALAATALGAAFLHAWGGGAEASSTIAPHGIVVVGDSITANYNDKPGHDRQGWWSIVARHLNADVTTFAQSGSGYVRSGERCTGNRFGDRTAVFERRRPALYLVEGGRNDWAYCYGGELVTASEQMISSSVDRYLTLLERSVADGSRIVIIGPPWGPTQSEEAARVTHIIAEVAAHHGLTFVDTAGTIDSPSRVVDGVHPNRAGSEAIAAAVLSELGG